MNDDRAKTPRTLLIADHIWDAFLKMAEEMGSDRDALINQALHTFARLNGFLLPPDLAKLGVVPRSALTDSGRLRIAPAPAEATTLDADEDDRRAQARSGREAQLAAAGVAMRSVSAAADDEAPTLDASEPVVASEPDPVSGTELLLLGEDGRELERVSKDRFVIGRGKHCDLVVNSGKVSREHAAIVHEGQAWFIEDLGSSNGTWFEGRRITRRQIQDGDEYFVCAEKLRCSFR